MRITLFCSGSQAMLGWHIPGEVLIILNIENMDGLELHSNIKRLCRLLLKFSFDHLLFFYCPYISWAQQHCLRKVCR